MWFFLTQTLCVFLTYLVEWLGGEDGEHISWTTRNQFDPGARRKSYQFASARTQHGLRTENKCDDRAQLACQTIRPTYQVCTSKRLT